MAIKCPKCQSDNPDASRFCAECGTQLGPSEEIEISHTKTLETPVEELTRGTVFASRYEIFEELGKGGMGKVYRVEDKKTGEELALKLIKPEISADKMTIGRFSNELKFAHKISHRNVCRMFHLGEEKGAHYITMEYVPGEDLKSFLRRSRRLDIGTAISISKQVCEGLAEAHRLGVVHRDLKPGNIMIDKEGNARIMDFGIARSLHAKGITNTGFMIGTPDYISPEQIEGKKADQRSDIYSLGVVLFEMLTGSAPFKGETPLSVAVMHKMEAPPDPKEINPAIPDDLRDLILRCMEKDEEERFQSAEELLTGLTKIEENLPTVKRVVPERKPITSRKITVTFGLRKAFIPVLVFIALIIAAVVIWQLIPQKEAALIPSDRPSLAIMYFKNNTGDEGLDHWRIALADLLITDLSQSRYIRVLSGEKLNQILSQLNQSETRSYSSDVLREVSERGGVRSIVVGNFIRADGTYRINITLQEGLTGELMGSESVEGKGERDFFSMVDELTRRIKTGLKFSEEEIATDIDKEVGIITTSSPEAYKYFIEANLAHRRGDYKKAISLGQKALESDPEFAMVYRGMSIAYYNLGLRQERNESILKAVELSHRVSDRERYLIQGVLYNWSEKTYDKAVETFKKLLKLYPEDNIAKSNLGWLYLNLEEWDKSIEIFSEIIKGEFSSAIAYWNLAESYMAKGKYEKAREVLERCRDNFPDNAYTYKLLTFAYTCLGKYDFALDAIDNAVSRGLDIDHIKLRGDIYLLKEDLIRSEEEYLKLPLESQKRRWSMAALRLYQGRFDEAKEQLKHETDSGEFLAYARLRYGNPEEALSECNKMLRDSIEVESISRQSRALHYIGLGYVLMKSNEKAQGAADELKELAQKSLNKKTMRYYHHLMGRIEFDRGNFSKAVEYLEKAESLLSYPRFLSYQDHAPFFDSLALACYKAENIENAREIYERIGALAAGRLYYGDIYAKSFFMLGKIYEEKEDRTKAIEQYERFLELWEDSDPGIPEVEDATKRLAGLKSKNFPKEENNI